MASIFIGTAGWPIPAPWRARFPGEGSLLERYAARLSAAEINSSFHRPHRPATYARWAAAVHPGFRFAVKIPKSITHEARLEGGVGLINEFMAQCGALGERLGAVLVQLPPSLPFRVELAANFWAQLRSQYDGPVVLEPREVSWFSAEATELLLKYRIGRVGADPALIPEAAAPGAWPEVVYYRCHGSPRKYYSPYDQTVLTALAENLVAHHRLGRDSWCIFDNTAAGAATANALVLSDLVRGE